MRISTVAENPAEWIALTFGQVPTPLCDVLLGPMLAKAVIAASGLHIFDALQKGPLPACKIAAVCATNPNATDRLLRVLSASRYLKERSPNSSGPPIYELTRASRRWLLTEAKEPLHFAILHREIDARFMDFERYVRTGVGRDFHRELDPADWQVYHNGQADQSRLIAREVVGHIRVPAGATQMLDLGGGHGLFSLELCTHYPNLHARVLDLAVPPKAETKKCPAWNRVAFEVSDIRSAVLPAKSAHLVLIANVIHHFDEATNQSLFKRAAEALTPGGILVALDLVRSSAQSSCSQIGSLMDLYFGAASGAQLWTLEQIRAWQEAAGLQPKRPVSLRMLPDCKIQIARKS